MTFNVVLPGVLLANVRYQWLTDAGFGAVLNAGITDPGAFSVFIIDATPPAGAVEGFAYDVNDNTNFSRFNYAQVTLSQQGVNVAKINNVTITGDGQPGSEFGV